MIGKHMNIKRILHRVAEEAYATRQIASVCGWTDALLTVRSKIDIQIMNRNGFKEPKSVKNRLLKRHEVTLKYIESKYQGFLHDYDFNPKLIEKNVKYQDKIWICWWQGMAAAPEIVKSCVGSIQRNTDSHEVIIITEENYHQFVDFPVWVEEKKNNGVISRTHYSDLLRLEVLARYGGLWLDSTFYCSDPCIDKLFEKDIWSIKRPDYLHCSIAGGQFANYSLACDSENRRIYAVVRDFLLHYWSENDRIIDYLLTDYLIVLAAKYDIKIGQQLVNIEPNNPRCDDLFKILGRPYDKELWNELHAKTGLFKLSWKHEFPLEVEGKKTFYARVLEGTL